MVWDLSYSRCFCTCVDTFACSSTSFLEGPGTTDFLNKSTENIWIILSKTKVTRKYDIYVCKFWSE